MATEREERAGHRAAAGGAADTYCAAIAVHSPVLPWGGGGSLRGDGGR